MIWDVSLIPISIPDIDSYRGLVHVPLCSSIQVDPRHTQGFTQGFSQRSSPTPHSLTPHSLTPLLPPSTAPNLLQNLTRGQIGEFACGGLEAGEFVAAGEEAGGLGGAEEG